MKRNHWVFGAAGILAAVILAGCPDPTSSSPPSTPSGPSAVTIQAVPGVTAPVRGAVPVTSIAETAQYTGTVAWNGSPAIFAAGTVYTATITLAAKPGYTFSGVAANFFTVAGAAAANAANSGVVTAVFPQTGDPDDAAPPANVTGLTAAAGNAQATLAWTNPADPDFAKVEITWTPTGGTQPVTVDHPLASKVVTGLTNGTAYTFTVRSVDTSGNRSAGVTASATPSEAAITLAAIPGVTAPVTGLTPAAVITPTDQYTGTVAWNGSPATFAAGTVYTATITLTAKPGYTFNGVAANFFTVAGADSVANAANSGVVTAVFPRTGQIEMVNVPGGSFFMGSPEGTGENNERPEHQVTLTAFMMGKYEVTQGQWYEVMGTRPSQFTENPEDTGPEGWKTLPVEKVSWYDALVFCNKLSMRENLSPAYRISGKTDPDEWGTVPTSSDNTWDLVEIVSGSTGYRLPTEAQWEYAARGGNGSPGGYAYAGSNTAGDVGWYRENSGLKTHQVGKKAANGLGLYDMSGNVLEWCWDWWYGSYFGDAQTNPMGPPPGSGMSARVARGGYWIVDDAEYLRSAFRGLRWTENRIDFLGFRLVRGGGITYTVTFNSGPAVVANQTVTQGGRAREPVNVTRTGYTLEGWYKEAAFTTRWNFAGGTVTADITLYAKWIENTPGVSMTRTVSGKEIKFRYVPDGSFQRDGTAANGTVITQGYWLGETEVTQELFQAVMGTNPSYFTSAVSGESGTPGKLPVEQVSWYDAIAFCNKLSVLDGKYPVYSVIGITDWSTFSYGSIPTTSNPAWNAATQNLTMNGYRLPSEMEWMWAAMGADKTTQPNTSGYNKAFAGSTGSNSINDYAWSASNSSNKTHEVGKKTANELNLFDMTGNLSEWVWDNYAAVIPSGNLIDPKGPDSGETRVMRGGSYLFYDDYWPVTNRSPNAPSARDEFNGFRVLAAAH